MSRTFFKNLDIILIHRDLKYAFLFASVHGKYSVVGYFGERFALILIHFVNADILRDCLDGKHTVRKANKSHTFAYVGVVENFSAIISIAPVSASSAVSTPFSVFIYSAASIIGGLQSGACL